MPSFHRQYAALQRLGGVKASVSTGFVVAWARGRGGARHTVDVARFGD